LRQPRAWREGRYGGRDVGEIDVDDLDRAIKFYRDGLDLRLGRRLFGNTVAEMVGASSTIYLLTKPAGSSASAAVTLPRSYDRHRTPVHLDFVVEHIGAAVEKARAAGAKIEGDIQTHVWGRLAVMADPFGHGICLIEFQGRGYDEVAS
jgi:predicted enzyme related to lactoylglutathione lyase